MSNSNCLQSTVYSLPRLNRGLPLLRKSVVSSRKAVNQSGQSLLEVIIALTVGILVVLALVFAVIFSLRNANFAKNSAQATKLAQEGIERVRTGRDRNSTINGILIPGVDSWSGSQPIWNYQISGSGRCDAPAVGLAPAGKCYFIVNSTGALSNIGSASPSVPTSSAEGIPAINPIFRRVVLLSDDLNHDEIFTNDDYQNQKEVTVIVQWTDFAGEHQSQLTTILRKL